MALDVDAIFEKFLVDSGLASELDLSAKSASTSRRPRPTEKEASHLPKRVKTKTTRHHRIADEVTVEEPKAGVQVELSSNEALIKCTAFRLDFGDAIEHQHRRRGQPGVHLTGQFTPAMRQQLFITKCVLPVRHMPFPTELKPCLV